MTLSERLKEIRKEKKLKLKDVSAGTGISIGHISDAERGARQISVKSLFLISEFYGIKPSELLEGVESV